MTAEVVYSRREDARKAMTWCNNVPIGGKSMKIEIVDANATSPADLPRPVAVSSGNRVWVPKIGQGRGCAMGSGG